MRRCVYLAIPILSLGLFACEDGPNQTYSPATGTLFNSGGALAQTGDAGAPIFLDGGYESYAGSSKQEVCGGGELQAQWSKMVQMPIAPPRFYAGLDVAGGDKYPGITVGQAINGPIPLPDSTEPPFIASAPHPSRLCQNTIEGPGPNSSDVGGDIISHWGNNAEVQMEYVTSTTKDYIMYLNPGYSGGITWLYTPMGGTQQYSYHFQINSQLTKTPVDSSGNPTGKTASFHLDWTDPNFPALINPEIDELYRGLVQNFAPDLYSTAEGPCYVTGTCEAFGALGDAVGHWEFGMRPISFYVETFNAAVSSQLGDTMAAIYSFNIKYAPYSLSSSNLSLAACGTGTTTPLCPFDQSQTYPLYGSGLASVVPAVSTLAANVGPIAYVTGLGDLKTNCVLKLNDTFGNLLTNCVNTSSDAATNTLTLNKIEGNLTHDDQNYTFSVVGINQNYRPASLMTPAGQFTVVSDTDVPQPADTADDFYLDTRAAGPIENDEYPIVAPDGSVTWAYDYHGSGAVMKEYQRLVQTELAADYVAEFAPGTAVKTLHDPTCLYPVGFATDKTFNASTFAPPPGCTGFEGLVTSGPSDGPNDLANLYNGDFDDAAGLTTPAADFFEEQGVVPGVAEGGFKPGALNAYFCNDLGTYTSCNQSLIFGGSAAQVLQVMGRGDLTKVPLEGRDVRFYFRMYEIAKSEYMHSTESLKRASNIGCTSDAMGNVACAGTPQPLLSANIQNAGSQLGVDLDYLILDSIGGGADRAEYVDYANTNATTDPLSLEDRDILVATNVQSTDFFERLDREERAMFVSMALVDDQPAWGYLHTAAGGLQLDDNTPTQYPVVNATMLMTNVFGSNTLGSVGFKATKTAAPSTYVNICSPTLTPGNKDAYYCATHNDADCPLHAPTDVNGNLITRQNGKPLLYGYCGAFQTAATDDGGAHTAFTVGSTSPMELISTQPLQQTAIISMPVLDNPYDISSANKPVQVLVPWKPMEEGIGYPVMFDGQQDVFVETFSLDFSGQVVTPVLDYLPVTNTDDAGNVTSTQIAIQAVETEDFLGDVFLCYDASTAGQGGDPAAPGDLLNVHLFTSIPTILSWLTAHPNAATRSGTCGIIIRYSPFNNYVDYIQSSTNGVRLGVDQGAGGGRIADATLFIPGSGAQATQ